MNCTVYLFGEFGLGYTQYPQDGAEDIFRHMAAHAEAQTQIAIHRDGNLMYYAFLRRLDEGEGHYIGYGLQVDGLLFRDLSPLFDLFGSTFENMVIADRLLTLNLRGHVVANVGLLLEKRPEVERVINNLCTSVQELSTQFIPLQKAIFDHLSTQVWKFGEDADPTEIRKASQMSGYTIVQKGRLQVAVDNPATNHSNEYKSYEGIRTKKENPEHYENIHQPNAPSNAPSEPKVNNTSPVQPVKKSNWDGMKTFLLVMLLLAVGGLAYTITQLVSLNHLESDAKSSYDKLKLANAELTNKIEELQSQLDMANLKSNEMEKRLGIQDSIITALRSHYEFDQPLLATSIYLTRETNSGHASEKIGSRVRGSSDLVLQPHVRYIGLEKGRARLTLRWRSPNSIAIFDFGEFSLGNKTHDDTKTFDINTGEHELDFDVWNGDSRRGWEPGRYRVELWSGNECLQKKEFWID